MKEYRLIVYYSYETSVYDHDTYEEALEKKKWIEEVRTADGITIPVMEIAKILVVNEQ